MELSQWVVISAIKKWFFTKLLRRGCTMLTVKLLGSLTVFVGLVGCSGADINSKPPVFEFNRRDQQTLAEVFNKVLYKYNIMELRNYGKLIISVSHKYASLKINLNINLNWTFIQFNNKQTMYIIYRQVPSCWEVFETDTHSYCQAEAGGPWQCILWNYV